MGAVRGVEGYPVAGGLGARGPAFGPLVGQAATGLVGIGRSRLDLEPYRPDRFGGPRER